MKEDNFVTPFEKPKQAVQFKSGLTEALKSLGKETVRPLRYRVGTANVSGENELYIKFFLVICVSKFKGTVGTRRNQGHSSM